VSCIGRFNFIFTVIFFRAQLEQNFTKTLTCESVKSLLPHPTSISNAINNIASRKKEFYAFLRNETKTSGMAVMIDGTSKTYHYTAIVITFIDINWLVFTFTFFVSFFHLSGN
jgi:hypothetical protein